MQKAVIMDIIVGGGNYGCQAVEFLRQKGKGFVVIDTNPNCLAVAKFGLKASSGLVLEGECFACGDLPSVLNLLERLKPEFVFPTAPVHIAADLVKTKLDLEPWIEGVNSVLPKLPQTVVLQAGKGRLIASFNRDHHCVDNCAMPTICPSSGIKKPCTMTEMVKFASPDAFVLVSHSMTPGMGALRGCELAEFLNWAATREKFIVATTCDCHAVLSAFKKPPHAKL